jgi:hypothetical protein
MQPHRFFIDTRNIIYDQRAFEEYLTVVEARPGWETVIAKYKIRYVLLNKKLRLKLISLMASSPKWKTLETNNDTVLFKLVKD